MAAVLRIRRLGRKAYRPVLTAMQTFTDRRDAATADELWLLEHPPVFTQGLNGKAEHLLDPGSIPVERIDRGGQVTYHGPGQLIVYCLLDLRRLDLGVRALVSCLEQAVVDLAARHGIRAAADARAPGVYVDGRKLASLGLRVRRGRCYHGLSLNVAMDLTPFRRINPCGHAGLEMTQLRDLGVVDGLDTIGTELAECLGTSLGYRHLATTDEPPENLREANHVWSETCS
ncbi:MAG: lipoyl(octanoyl) transferase LipB [Candidatus Competibacterales bacterium]|nr:lipoyl(octanoyl) transferase LipB [Candidatus Competibacterales bacterium]